MDIYLNEYKQTRDDTIEPAYLKNRLLGVDSGGGTSDAALAARVSSLESRTSTLTTKVNTLTSSQTTQDNKINALEVSQTSQDTKIKSLEESQEEQDNRLDDIEEQLDSIGTTTTIINYITSIIGKDVPEAIAKSPSDLAEWLVAQDEDGIDLANLSKRIEDIETDIISIEEIAALFN